MNRKDMVLELARPHGHYLRDLDLGLCLSTVGLKFLPQELLGGLLSIWLV